MKELLLVCFVLIAECATPTTSSPKYLSINRKIPKAKVWIDDEYVGETPLVLTKLSTQENHIIKIEAESYATTTYALKRKDSAWVWGNITLGDIIGLVINLMTDEIYVFDDKDFVGNLIKIEKLKHVKQLVTS